MLNLLYAFDLLAGREEFCRHAFLANVFGLIGERSKVLHTIDRQIYRKLNDGKFVVTVSEFVEIVNVSGRSGGNPLCD